MKKNLLTKMMVMVIMTAMLISMTACGSETEETTSSEAAGASESSDVMTVKVGTGNGAAPFCFLDEDGNAVGYDIDVLAELDKRLEGYEFDLQVMDFPTLIVSIDSGSIDMLSHQLVKSDARKEKYLFPEQYYCLSPMSLAVKDDSGINGMADMAGKSLDQNPSAYEYQMLVAYNDAHPGEEIIINAVSDQTNADAYKKVSNGQVDASLTYQATFSKVVEEIGLDNLVLTDVVMCEDTYMMFTQDNQELCDAIDAELANMVEDGTLSEISMNWFSEDVFTEYADIIAITTEE